MAKQNCWEFLKCGREPKGKNAHELGICPAAIFTEADGFCDGKNGGRACTFIAGTFCPEIIKGTHKEKWKDCSSCNFYKILLKEQGTAFSIFAFDRYVKEREKKGT